MQTINIYENTANIFQLMDQVTKQHEPLMLTGNGGSAVLISEEEWRGIQETIYLSGIPGMVESIVNASKEPISEGTPYEKLEW